MKRLLVLVIMTLGVISTSIYAQSEIYHGDKTIREQKKAVRLINKRITNYRLIIRSISQHRAEYRDGEDSVLIASYYQKINFLEDQLDDASVAIIGKDTKQHTKLKSRDPRKSAEAYLLMKYADNLDQHGNGNYVKESVDSVGLKGIVVNNWYYEVIAQVTGPGNFFREFNIKPNKKSPEFSIPVVGEYTTTFIFGNQRKMITKQVMPNIIYYDGNVVYAYKTTLPRN